VSDNTGVTSWTLTPRAFWNIVMILITAQRALELEDLFADSFASTQLIAALNKKIRQEELRFSEFEVEDALEHLAGEELIYFIWEAPPNV